MTEWKEVRAKSFLGREDLPDGFHLLFGYLLPSDLGVLGKNDQGSVGLQSEVRRFIDPGLGLIKRKHDLVTELRHILILAAAGHAK